MSATEPRLLGARYELGEPLGFGGMAEVLAGRDVRLGRDVAIKILRADLARDPSFLSRFRREAQSAAGLNHPNIVAVYDTGEGEDGVPYIVMERVSGRTLRDVLAEDGRLLPRRAMEIAAEVAGALEYSHRAGIVHRDIKPANVMLTRAGDVKVMDFGIARAASTTANTMTQTAQVLGTAQYLSPEQALGEHVDARSDIYSCGCLLYELLTGIPPFRGDSAVAVAYQHVREDPTPPSQLDSELPAAADAVVLKAMAKNPDNRYQSAAEMRLDLDRAAAGRRVEAPSVLANEVTTALPVAAPTTVLLRQDDGDRRSRRGLAYLALLAAVLIVFIVAAVLAKNLFSGSQAALHTPKVVGLTEQQARDTLSTAGLQVGDEKMTPLGQDGNTLAKGQVYAQSPIEGITISRGGKVSLSVSSGIERVPVPDVVGKSTAEATGLINQAKLKVGIVTQENVPGTPTAVLMVTPTSGTTVDAGTPVNLTVVSGQQQVPSELGKPEADAISALKGAGFKVAVTMVQDPATAGTVIDESPTGAQPNGTTITLTVSSGPPAPPAPPTTAAPPPTTAAPPTTSPPASSTPPPASSTPPPSSSPVRSSSPLPTPPPASGPGAIS